MTVFVSAPSMCVVLLDLGLFIQMCNKVHMELFKLEFIDFSSVFRLLTPPGTPLFPSLEMESQKTVMSQLGTPKARPTALKSRVSSLKFSKVSVTLLYSVNEGYLWIRMSRVHSTKHSNYSNPLILLCLTGWSQECLN